MDASDTVRTLGVEVQYSSEIAHMLDEAAKAGEAQVFAAKNLLLLTATTGTYA